MNPSFHRFRLSLTVSLVLGGIACTPDNSVKSGAPVLTELMLLESGNPYTITAETTTCAATVADGVACDTSMGDSICRIGGGGGPDGGAADAGADGGAASSGPINWCRCPSGSQLPSCPLVPGAPGTWNCGPFAPTTAVFAVFDRVIDPGPLDPGDAGAVTDVATLEATPAPPMPVAITADYQSNYGTDFKVKPVLFGPLSGCAVFFGFPTVNYTSDGPSIMLTPTPQLPANSEVTITLTDKIRAKDGKTKFVGAALVVDGAVQPSFLTEGAISFTTGPFAASFTVPMAMDDGGAQVAVPPDATPVTITFNAPVDPAAIVAHVHVTANGTTPIPAGTGPADVTITSDGFSVTVTPNTAWPASSTIEVTVDATATDVLGDPLGTVSSGHFDTAAM